YGTTATAVNTQICTAISVYVLVAIVKKRLNTEASLYTILQILSLTLFEKTPIDQLVKNADVQITMSKNNNQMNLFN
ncbi:MAG: IS4 family transposase, partial [Nitrosomonas sp.]|nr:IS4 family transposase [Nitrosomonas sp.]